MKAAVMFMLLACLCTEMRAEWKDLKPGMDQRTAAQCVGQPLLQNRGRGGAEAWTYDRCGYIQFHYGRVSYWETPKPAPNAAQPAKAVAAKAASRKAPPTTLPRPSKTSTIALGE